MPIQNFPSPYNRVQRILDPLAPGRYCILRKGQPALWFTRKKDADYEASKLQSQEDMNSIYGQHIVNPETI